MGLCFFCGEWSDEMSEIYGQPSCPSHVKGKEFRERYTDVRREEYGFQTRVTKRPMVNTHTIERRLCRDSSMEEVV